MNSFLHEIEEGLRGETVSKKNRPRWIVDLHCHTTFSDGSLSVKETLSLARGKGVTHLAITDHDTTRGVKKAVELGHALEIEIIPGIEISAYDFKRKRRAHILGYYIQPEHKALKKLCDPLIARRQQASRKMIEILSGAGYKITWERVLQYAGNSGVFKQHIMHALVAAGYSNNIFSNLAQNLFSRGEQGQPRGIAYIPIAYIDAIEAIKTIRSAGGVPVLAHPGQYDNLPAVPEWISVGLEGLEVKHPAHDAKTERKIAKLAQDFELVMTGGSDFHGLYGEHSFSLGDKNPGIESVRTLKEKAVHQNS